MATREQLEAGILAADKNGDTEGVRILGQALLDMNNPPEPKQGFAHGAGLAARGLIQNGLAVPNLALDLGIGAANFINRGTNAIGLTDAAQFPSASELTSRALTHLGLPEPQTRAQAIATDVVGAATGAPALAKFFEGQAATMAPGAQKAILEILGKERGMQSASAATGAAAGDVAQAAGAGPVGTTIASMAGAALPAAAKYAGSGATRAAIRGGEEGRQQYNQNRATFEQAGIDQPFATQLGGRSGQAIGSTISKIPGGAGVFAEGAAKEAEQIGAKVNQLADQLIPNANATKAGLTIERGLKNFLQRFKGEQNFLYGKVDDLVPKDTRVGVEHTMAALEDLNATIPGAPETSKFFQNSRIKGIEGALRADTETTAGVMDRVPPIQQTLLKMMPKEEAEAILRQFVDGKLPWEALTKLRTLVGREITDHSLASDVPRSKWKALYAALSQDMDVAAQEAGPEAKKALDRATWYTRAGHDRIETVLDRVSGKDTAEKVFQAAVNASEVKEGSTTLNAVMRSLTPEERPMVMAATIKRLGQAVASQQDDVGSKFSAETFLTHWNKISDPAKAVLFPDRDIRAGLDAIAATAAQLRTGSKVFANPSGTAPAAGTIGLVAGSVANPVMLPKLAALVGGSYVGAKVLQRPDFVKWVGRATQLSPGMIPGMLHELNRLSQKWSPEEQAALKAAGF